MKNIEELLNNYLEKDENYNFSRLEYAISQRSVIRSWGGVIYLQHPVDRITGEKVELFGFKPLLLDCYKQSVFTILEWPWVDVNEYMDEYERKNYYL